MENVPDMLFCIKYMAEKFKLWNLCSPARKVPSRRCTPEGLAVPRSKGKATAGTRMGIWCYSTMQRTHLKCDKLKWYFFTQEKGLPILNIAFFFFLLHATGCAIKSNFITWEENFYQLLSIPKLWKRKWSMFRIFKCTPIFPGERRSALILLLYDWVYLFVSSDAPCLISELSNAYTTDHYYLWDTPSFQEMNHQIRNFFTLFFFLATSPCSWFGVKWCIMLPE